MNPKLLSEILSFTTDPNRKIFSIKGKAGTGKTEIIKELFSYFEKQNKFVSIATPTNKASSVLRNRGIPASTIHKLLYRSKKKYNIDGEALTRLVQKPIMDQRNLKEFLKDENGNIVYQTEEQFVYENIFDETKLAFEILDFSIYLKEIIKDDQSFKIFDSRKEFQFKDFLWNNFILITDESSMINAETWKNLIENTSFKIIAVGDVNQLDPVETNLKKIQEKIEHYDIHNENEFSPEELYNQFITEQELQKQYGRYFHRISPNWVCATNHRTKSKNILTVFENILSHPYAQYPLNFWHEDVQVIPENSGLLTNDDYNSLLEKADIVIAWKNETVSQLNRRIREIKFPMIMERLKGMKAGTLPLPGIGEPLYVNSTFSFDYNDDNCAISKGEIISIINDKKEIDLGKGIMYCTIQVRNTNEVFENFPICLNFLGYSYGKRKNIDVCKVDFAYAITCHKAQGSQWKEVLIIDEYTSTDVLAKRKWRYTAITRAEEMLTVIVKG